MPNISPLSEGNNRPLLEDLNDHHEFWLSVLDNDQRSNRYTFHTEIEDSSNPNKRGHCSSDLIIVSHGLINGATCQTTRNFLCITLSSHICMSQFP